MGRGLKQVIAKHDVWFSNSMVEAVFRQFKQKFFLKKPITYRALYQCIYKFVNQYNYNIPHSSLMGVTPAEELNGVSVVSLKERFRQELKAIRLKRREEYQKCEDCRVRYISDFNLQGRVLSQQSKDQVKFVGTSTF